MENLPSDNKERPDSPKQLLHQGVWGQMISVEFQQLVHTEEQPCRVFPTENTEKTIWLSQCIKKILPSPFLNEKVGETVTLVNSQLYSAQIIYCEHLLGLSKIFSKMLSILLMCFIVNVFHSYVSFFLFLFHFLSTSVSFRRLLKRIFSSTFIQVICTIYTFLLP